MLYGTVFSTERENNEKNRGNGRSKSVKRDKINKVERKTRKNATKQSDRFCNHIKQTRLTTHDCKADTDDEPKRTSKTIFGTPALIKFFTILYQ
jgi:hypothetical protein